MENGGRLVLQLSWPIMTLLVIILATVFGLAALAVLTAPVTDVTALSKAISEGNSIARVVALVIIVPSIFVLTLVGRIDGAVAAAALSGIAGYVLGGTMPK